MTSADIGFIGAVFGVAIGCFGFIFGTWRSGKKYVFNKTLSDSEKLVRAKIFFDVAEKQIICLTLFGALLAFLIYFLPAKENPKLYSVLLVVLIFTFFVALRTIAFKINSQNTLN